MPNVTMDLVVEQMVGVSPRPGRDLVVYEREGTGKRFREVVPKDVRPRKTLWERLGSETRWITYAVSRDENLIHRFTVTCTSREGIGPLAVQLALHFQVRDPLRIAETVESDPLQRLADRAAELVRRSVEGLAWHDIVARRAQIETAISWTESTSDGGEKLAHRSILTGLAGGLGFALKGVEASMTLPSRISAHEEKLAEAERQNEIRRREHKAQLEREEEEREREAARRIGRVDLDERVGPREEQHKDFMEAAMGQRKLRNAAIDAAATAMGNVASGIQTSTELIAALRSFNDVAATPESNGGAPRRRVEGAGPVNGALPAVKSESLEAYADSLFELVHRVPERRQRGLLSIGLKLLGEAALGPGADPAVLTELALKMKVQAQELASEGGIGSVEERTLLQALQSSSLKDRSPL
jgi:hypothetical protein